MSLYCSQPSPKTTLNNWLSFALVRDAIPFIYTGPASGILASPVRLRSLKSHFSTQIALRQPCCCIIDDRCQRGRCCREAHRWRNRRGRIIHIWAWRLLKASSAMIPMMMCMDIAISTSDIRAIIAVLTALFKIITLYAREAGDDLLSEDKNHNRVAKLPIFVARLWSYIAVVRDRNKLVRHRPELRRWRQLIG